MHNSIRFITIHRIGHLYFLHLTLFHRITQRQLKIKRIAEHLISVYLVASIDV